jgi:hypothetical protein
MRNLIIFPLLSLWVACQVPEDRPDRFASGPKEPPSLCEPAREYITTTRFLREQRDTMGLRDIDIHRIADEVSKGCVGSAGRFVRAFHVLDKMQVGANATVTIGARLAQKNEAYTDVYLGVLTRAYLSEFLDLDLMTSMRLAESLSVDYTGDVKIALNDFTKMVDFCLKSKTAEFPLPFCGALAGRLAKASENFRVGLADSFIRSFDYLTQTQSLNMKLGEAVATAEQLAVYHPQAIDSFITAHSFALEKTGLDLDARRSLVFARRIASRTRWEEREENPLSSEPQRSPASEDLPAKNPDNDASH